MNDKAEQVENLQREERTNVILIPFTLVHGLSTECHTSPFTLVHILSTEEQESVIHPSRPLWSNIPLSRTDEHPPTVLGPHYGVSIASLHSGSISRAMVGRSNFNNPGNSNRRASLSQYGVFESLTQMQHYSTITGFGHKPGIVQFHFILLPSRLLQ